MKNGERKRASGRVVPHRASMPQRIAAKLVTVVLRVVAATRPFHFDDRGGGTVARAGPVIFAVWHNRLALSMAVYKQMVLQHAPSRRMAALVSASRDGAFLAEVLRASGVTPVRGSSSRRGPQALLEMTSWAEQGFDLALTPDGPRGPRYVVQEGAVALASVTRLPIVPVGINTGWRVSLRSWDAFQVPLPFGRCHVIVGRAVEVDGSEPERIENARQGLENELRAITRD